MDGKLTSEELVDELIDAACYRSQSETFYRTSAERTEQKARAIIIARLDQRDDLLAAAKGAAASLRGEGIEYVVLPETRAAISALEAAITKAEGQTP